MWNLPRALSPRRRPLAAAVATIVLLAVPAERLYGQGSADSREQRFSHNGRTTDEGAPGFFAGYAATSSASGAPEAPTGYDNLTNGFLPQGPAFGTLTNDSVVAQRSFNDNRFIFEQVETVADGIGPVYNAQSCRECHENVVTGGASQIAEHRTGRVARGRFYDPSGGSLIHSRATHPDLVEKVAVEDDVRSFRLSTSTLGSGYVEAVANATLTAIRDAQPAAVRGTAVMVPVLEGDGSARIGRFGWKNQHASLVSFSADAYLNEMGITSPLLPEENTSSGRFVGYGSGYDPVPEPEDDGNDLLAFAGFMRSTKAPPRGAITADVLAGERVFTDIGCASCHVATIVTAPAGTSINAGAFVVPEALGNKAFHPYSDFLLHDVGTGDGIPVLSTAEYASTANQIRTAPLWGLRTRNRLMHDGLTFTREEAIRRHAGQAASVTAKYKALGAADRARLLAFLDSL